MTGEPVKVEAKNNGPATGSMSSRPVNAARSKSR
jgi:hypothetical protein